MVILIAGCLAIATGSGIAVIASSAVIGIRSSKQAKTKGKLI